MLNALSESNQSEEIEIQAQEDIETEELKTKTQEAKAKNEKEKESEIQHLFTEDLEAFPNLISTTSHTSKLTIFFDSHLPLLISPLIEVKDIFSLLKQSKKFVPAAPGTKRKHKLNLHYALEDDNFY